MIKTNKEELIFVPLGGTEEIGMNFNLYGLGIPDNHDWLIIDLGITFGDDSTPGVEIIVPDPTFIEKRKKNLLGIVLTHGHEDHIGAVPYLWNKLRCPVYATPFTATLLRKKIEVWDTESPINIIEVPLQGKFSIGSFSLELITLTHSMPEPNALAIRTPLGTIFHTGDWKFDPAPVIGETSNFDALTALGKEGVLAAIGDSTNVFVDGVSGSESSLLKNLTKIIGNCSGKVAVACFASNVARLQTIFEAATANGRIVCLVGRSLWRINAAARETGYLSDLPPFLEASQASTLPKDQVLYICTGSQGEPRAALTRIATGIHRDVELGKGDSVIFSSRIIPGNELAIGRLQNSLVKRGISVISEQDENVHVSGHPARDELIKMYQLIQPQIAIPVHGEHRHLSEHSDLARQCQVPETVLVQNGTMVKLAPGRARVIGDAPVGRLSAEGGRLHPMDGDVVRDKTRILNNGSAVLTLIIDKNGSIISEPKLTTHAIMDEDEHSSILEMLIDEIDDALDAMDLEDLLDDKTIAEMARVTVRRSFRETHGKRPLVSVHVVRI